MNSPKKKRQPGDFVYAIFTADGGRHRIEAPSLRTALRNCGIDERKSSIVAAVEEACLPQPAEDRPFQAVFLKNPNFQPPEVP